MIKNILLILGFSGFSLAGCSIIASNKENPKKESAQMLGGCGAPQFFTHYNKIEVNKIAESAAIKRVDISYPHKLEKLAEQINKEITANSKAKVSLTKVDLKDTDSVTYRHDAVVVMPCFK